MRRLTAQRMLLACVLSSFAVFLAPATTAQSELPPGWVQKTWEGITISYPPNYTFSPTPPFDTARVSVRLVDPRVATSDIMFSLEASNGVEIHEWARRKADRFLDSVEIRDTMIGGRPGVNFEICVGDGCAIYYVVAVGSELLVVNVISTNGVMTVEALPEVLRLLQFEQTEQCFPETGQCFKGRFAAYWSQYGGLPVFGYPITSAADEPNRDTGTTYLTQWFERNRFELHPENQAPYDVLLGRLGDDRLKQQGRDWQTFPKADPSSPHYFAATGHAVPHDPFWRYWSTHGLEFDGQPGTSETESLALFGLPLSEPSMETNSSGDTVLTQWFERARFEDHGSKGVLLGLLGNEVRGTR